MNAYIAMENRHQQEVNALPIKFAFSDKQFEEGMKALGLKPTDTDKVYALHGTGGFYRRTDADIIRETFRRHQQEREEAIAADKDGTGYLYQMFRYELANHEYCITYDLEPTIEACGFTVDEVNGNPALLAALKKARKDYLEEAEKKEWF